MRVISRFRRRSEEERTGSMTVMEHLEELRHRLIIAIIAVGARVDRGVVPLRPVHAPDPASRSATSSPAIPTSRRPTGCRLNFQGIVDGLVVKLKIVGSTWAWWSSLPIVLYQLWAFIVPGLTAKEKKWSIPFIVSATRAVR